MYNHICYRNAYFSYFGGNRQLNFSYCKYSSDKPVFRLSHHGNNATKYEIEVNINSNFSSGTSWTQTYTGIYPENTQTNFEFNQTEGSLTEGLTYYVRARIDQGYGWGAWTTEHFSFTYGSLDALIQFFKTTTPQFSEDALVGIINLNDELKTDASGSGTLTSTSSNIASIELFKGYEQFKWNQTLGTGNIKLTIQGSGTGTKSYSNIAGFVDVSLDGDEKKSLIFLV